MKWIYKGLLVSLGILISNYSFSQETNSDTLKLSLAEAQTYALQYNRSVQSAKIDVESAKKKVWETTAIGLPQVSLSANYQHQFVIPELNMGPYLDPTLLPDGAITKNDILNAYKQSPSISLGFTGTNPRDVL